MARAVAGGNDHRIVGAPERIGHDAVLACKTGCRGELDIGHNPDADDDEIGRTEVVIAQAHRAHVAVLADELAHRRLR